MILLVVLGLLCAAGAIAVAYGSYRFSGSAGGAVLVLFLALLPLPVVIGSFLWLDRYEPEPLRYMVAAVAWGAVGAAGLSLVLNTWSPWVDGVSFRWLATLWAPVHEEFTKGLFLLALLLLRRDRLRGVIDGVIYAGLTGIGFAFSENILYYSGGYSGDLAPDVEGAQGAVGVFVARGIVSPFAHPMFCIALGVGVGLAVSTHRRWVRWAAPLLGLAGAMALHAIWNGSGSFFGPLAFLAVYGLGFFPMFFAAIAGASYLRTQQGRVLIRALADAADRGWLHPDEIPWLTRFGFKRRARQHALATRGAGAKTAVTDYQRLATRLGFAHDRVLRGTAGPRGADDVHALLGRLHEVRPWVVLPPPIRVVRRQALPSGPFHGGGPDDGGRGGGPYGHGYGGGASRPPFPPLRQPWGSDGGPASRPQPPSSGPDQSPAQGRRHDDSWPPARGGR